MNGIEIDIFDASTHGRSFLRTEQELDDVVRHFDASIAPVKIGHKQPEEEAHGWLSGLRREGSRLYATLSNVSQTLADKVKTGALRNRSAEFRHTDAGWRLRGVAFLGASIPECKGLSPIPEFSEDGSAIFFAEGTGLSALDEERNMNLEERIAQLESENARLQEQVAKFEEGEKFAELEAERDALKDRIAAFEEADQAREQQAKQDRAVAAFETLKASGHATPAEKADLIAEFAELDPQVIEKRVTRYQSFPPKVTKGAAQSEAPDAADFDEKKAIEMAEKAAEAVSQRR